MGEILFIIFFLLDFHAWALHKVPMTFTLNVWLFFQFPVTWFFCDFLQEKYIWARVWRHVLCSFNCEVCFSLGAMMLLFLFLISWVYNPSHFDHNMIDGLMRAQVCCCIGWSSQNLWPGGCWASSGSYQ